MKWLDIEDIAEKLNESHPEFDVISLRFTMLKKMILDLDGFADDQDKCNEKILEAVQAAWLELQNE
jgi:FeS assembly protein IscX